MATERIQRRIARLLDQIEEAMERLDWESVRSSAQAVLALDADNLEASAFLGAADQATRVSTPQATSHPATSTLPTTASTPSQPTSFADGRYQVQKFLGEGGKKKVYLAHDTTLDREVAFALLRPRVWTKPLAPAPSVRLRPWDGWGPTLKSSPSST